METVILLNLNKTSTLEFDVDIKGIDPTKSTDIRFCFSVNEITYCFKAKQNSTNKNSYSVEIPKMKDIPKTTYPFKIEVISDGYYFEALKGAVNITVDPLIKITPKNIDYSKDNKKEEANEKVNKIDKKEEANEKVNKIDKKEEAIKEEPIKEEFNVKDNKIDKDLKVKKIIESFNKINNKEIKPNIIVKKGNVITN